jgi:WXG100 family type VII secretion target
MAMAMKVVVGPNAQSNAQQFLSAVQTFSQEIQKIQSAGQKLASSGDWEGASAKKFHDDLDQFTRAAHQMGQSLTHMAQGAKSVITTIDTTDQQGVGRIGGFSG